jgi:pimeloyl-ACP methyl ester carboxylesterase
VGWSDGAVVALLVAQHRPDLVERLVLIGQYYDSSGKVPGGLTEQLRAGGEEVMGFLRAEYDRLSPDGPEHFPVVFAKTLRMLANEPELDLSSLAAVAAPTLVLQGDRDEVTLEHGATVAAPCPRDGWRCSRAPTPCRWRTRPWSTRCWSGSSPERRRPSTGPPRDPVADPAGPGGRPGGVLAPSGPTD